MCVRGVAGCVLKGLTFLYRIRGLKLTWTFEVLERGINFTIISVFQIVLKSKGKSSQWGEWKILLGEFFHQLVGI